MLFCTVLATLAFAQGARLPKLVVPKGAAFKLNRPLEKRSLGTPMTAAQVREVVAADRKVRAVLPWATLSARRMHVAGKASVDALNLYNVSGLGDVWQFVTPGGSPNVTLDTWIEELSAGKTFVVVLNGTCTGTGILGYQTGAGSGELPVSTGPFSFPIALVSNGQSYPFLGLKVKTPPTFVYVDSIQVFRVE